ncbi:MAG TPA: MiaB/RimO family radical SAM methylthiotransferase [Longimicrobiales bacterium]
MDLLHTMTHDSVRRRRAYVETYGCQMNISDGELMQGILAAQGFELADRPEEADVILVNTCAVREHAEQRVLGRVGQLRKLKKHRPDLVIGVTGCMAQRMGEALLDRAPYVDLVMGPDGYRRLPDVLRDLRPGWLPGGAGAGDDAAGARPAVRAAPAGRRELPVLGAVPAAASAAASVAGAAGARPGVATSRPVSGGAVRATAPQRVAVLDFQPHENYEGLEVRRGSRVSAWVPIQRGCNYRCTYCIVPYTRGSEKNRDPERILEEVRSIAAQGIPEVVLLGQTVNSYEHGEWDFPRLLRAVARVDGIRRVRFTSPHPNDVSERLVEVMATEPTVCRQIHLPVQAGHDRTLKRMLRRYTVAAYLEKVRLLRSAIPEIALSTDVIVAFPGETEEEFEATLDLLRAVRYDDAFLYRYSPRDGTPATRLPREQFIPDAVAQERLERVIALQRQIQAEINRGEVGRTVEVLVEREARSEGDVLGRTESNKVVAFPGGPELVGRFMRVRLTGTTGATFTGEVVGPGEEVGRVA